MAVFALAFAPDGRTIATNSGQDIELWDVTDPRQPRAAGRPLSGHLDFVQSLAFAPGGRILASGGYDGRVILWDISDRERPQIAGQPLIAGAGPRPSDGSAGVHRIAYTPDGETLAVYGSEGAVQLWDVRGPLRPISIGQPYTGEESLRVLSLTFTADGRNLVVPGANTGYVWSVERLLERRDAALARACAIAGRGLTPAEWAENLPGIDYQDTCTQPAGS